VSLRSALLDDAFLGGDQLFLDGYDQLTNHLAEGLTIHTSTWVQQVDYRGKGVRVTTQNETFEADAVLVTVSVGVLKAEKIEFIPALPAKKQLSIDRIHMGLLNKIVLDFDDEGPWPIETEGLGLVSDFQSAGLQAMNMSPVTGKRTLVFLDGGGFAKKLEKESDEAQVERVMTALRNVYGETFPAPKGWTVTRWHQNPTTLGSYSYLPPGSTVQDRITLGEPIGNQVYFAGEATHKRYPSTVHGAYLSGKREAKKIHKRPILHSEKTPL
jgi:monoamine oxidase